MTASRTCDSVRGLRAVAETAPAGPVLQEQLRYWQENLQGAPELLSLPTDHARPVQAELSRRQRAVGAGRIAE